MGFVFKGGRGVSSCDEMDRELGKPRNNFTGIKSYNGLDGRIDLKEEKEELIVRVSFFFLFNKADQFTVSNQTGGTPVGFNNHAMPGLEWMDTAVIGPQHINMAQLRDPYGKMQMQQ